jgi:hypothetical protein
MRALGLALCLALCACGHGGEGETTTPRDTRPTVELAVRDPRGGFVHIGDLHGQVVLIVVLSTFDTVSQAQLTDLERFVLHNPDVAVVGVLFQPSAAQLADAYVLALQPSFPMGYDPDGVLEEGGTALGTIGTVPTLVALDRAGHVVSRREGYQPESVLDAMVLDAGARIPPSDAGPPPLLGTPPPR